MKNSLLQVLNESQYTKTTDILEVKEQDEKATVRSVVFYAQDYEFISFDKQLINKSNVFQSCTSCKCLNLICDGVFFIEKGNYNYLFLVELKSQFASQEIHRAKGQIEASFLKCQTLLNTFEKYKESEWHINTFIISRKPSDEKINKLNKLKNESPKENEYRFSLDLALNGISQINKNQSIVKELPLKFQNFQVHYIPYETIEKTGINIANFLA